MNKMNSRKMTNNKSKASKSSTPKNRIVNDNGVSEPKSSNSKDVKKGSNDVSWYSKNPELLKSAGSLGFSFTTGLPTGFSGIPTIPGIFTMGWTPAYGGLKIEAVNVSADSIYSFTVHANSRNTSYSAKDEMILIMAGANVYSAMAYMIRAYGVMKTYTQENRYLPHTLISRMGLSFSDLQSNLGQMWFDINRLIARCGQIWIPNTLPCITRWFWMNSNVYTDAQSVKSQLYMFVPTGFLKYDDASFDTGGALVPALLQEPDPADPTKTIYRQFNPYARGKQLNTFSANHNEGYTWSQLVSVIEGMIDALMNSTDRGVIFGDILKAYGVDKIYGLSEIPVDFRLYPTYDPEVLTQIENASFMGNDLSSDLLIGLYQNMTTNMVTPLYRGSTLPSGSTPLLDKTILNFHQASNPTPEQVMVATRLHTNGFREQTVMQCTINRTTGTFNMQSGTSVLPYSTGTEMIAGAYACMLGQVGQIDVPSPDNVTNKVFGGAFPYDADANINNALKLACFFDWSPFTYVAYGKSSAPSAATNLTYAFYGDVDNVCVVNTDDIYKLHVTAVLSEFDVPTI